MVYSQLKVLLVLTCLAHLVASQGNQPATDNVQYHMDNNADCNGPIRDVNEKRAIILGRGDGGTEEGPLKCILSLRTKTAFDSNKFRIEIADMTIQEAFVTFTIYDGMETQRPLDSFDDRFQFTRPIEHVTTGSLVTFILERRHAKNTKYSIRIVASPVILGEPGYENDWGNDYGYYYKRLPTTAIVGIVGGAFALVAIVVVGITVACYRKQRGEGKRWEEHKLSYVNTSAAAWDTTSTKGAMSDTTSAKIWASDVSRSHYGRRPIEPRSRIARPSEDEDSVFDEPAPRRYRNEPLNYREAPPGYTRYPSRSHPRRSDPDLDDSFVQANDHHPQDTFIERVIEPRVKTKPRRWQMEDDDDDDEDPVKRSSIGTGPDRMDQAIQGQEEDEEEEEEENEETDTEDEEEEEESEEEEPKPITKPSKPPRKSLPLNQSQPERNLPPSSSQPVQPVSLPQGPPPPQELSQDPRLLHSMPPNAQMVARPIPQYVPIQAYPGGPQQFVAVPTGPNQFQPVLTTIPPPRYPEPKPDRSNVQPTDPPIYSYLVQRGYVPVDGRGSPDSASTGASYHSGSRLLHPDDSERSGNLESGVEFMRR